VFAGQRHLDDSALIRRYLADRGLEALEARDEAVVRHLALCEACGARYAALQSAFDETRRAVSEDALAVCSPERMARQRERILRQIDNLSEGPRVLPFPAAAPAARGAREHRVRGRWIAAAAAAGLMVGMTAGRLLYTGGNDALAEARQRTAASASQTAARAVPAMRATNVDPAVSEDQFLSEVELATAAPRAAELRAIYAFTLEESREPFRRGKD
jgi:hypothetical protein